MTKGQRRGNKEIRKPKQDKQPKSGAAGNASPMKIVEAAGSSARKKT
jgi:hypothetical protein